MLTHYIIVRRDLPLGVLAAMITHAAGESGALYQDPYDGRFRDARAVVLEAKDEKDLYRVARKLQRHGIQYTQVVETGPTYFGELMAIGLVPVEPGKRVEWDKTVEDVMRPFQTLKGLSETTKELDKADDSA